MSRRLFYYDSETFSLHQAGAHQRPREPGPIVYTLGADTRELANRPNVTIPTNIEVVNEVRDDFGTFYQLSETITNPGAAAEYSWDASSCIARGTLTRPILLLLGLT